MNAIPAAAMASRVARRFLSVTPRRLQAESQAELKRETKRNPELMILGCVMAAALGGAGLYLGRSPTGATSEVPVNITSSGMPSESDAQGKYKYHPGGDNSKDPREAPSALNVVVVPKVTLPRELHDKWNKWGKDGYP